MNLPPLTKSEKWTLVLSLVAILVSLASPPITYYWLQNAEREQTLKAHGLRASGSFWDLIDAPEDGKITRTYRILLENSGRLSISSVQIPIVYYGRSLSESDKKIVALEPPLRFTLDSVSETSFVITLSDPLPPRDKVRVIVAQVIFDGSREREISAPSAWVRSEASPNVPMSWTFSGAGW